MATGELVSQSADTEEPGYGVAITATGRRSVAKMYEPATPSGPFTPQQLARLDEALTFASRETGLDFSIYLGELGSDSRQAAERLHDSVDNPGNAVLIAVSPGERLIEIVTGGIAFQRLPDRGAKLAAASMVASFKEGDLVGGLVNALRMLADQAGPAPKH
ncbi:protein of unknown function [Amycolatopsis xylanica]|uniref:TLP18.3, Psb32 and MOLO-1 founding protein of phosphatase n=1 Tax=Amycolatopsis xylanica TaxID=589385 RepID=A0A1H3HT39_9PSEU|nr:DUF5130 family protein [Amycolatopsis xylanica]SDY17869.1 protein of unknown function [Amycolatopsis xylanica]